jgi:hypothetical protein
MDQCERQQLIEQYRNGYQMVTDALRQITEMELDARPAPDEWTVREIVHHLADSEMTSAIRLRRLLAEHEPEITGYDEMEFARRLFYGDRPIEASLEAFAAARKTTAEIIDRMTEDDWNRAGRHSEQGHYSTEDWLRIYAAHAANHAEQIRRARVAVSSNGGQ